METNPQQYCFASISDLVVTLAQKITSYLSKRLTEQDQVSLVVSGGQTPKMLYQQLSVMDLDWSRVMITLTDERWVPIEDHNSNEWMIKNYLLINKAQAAHWISLKTKDATPEQAIKIIHARLQKIPKPYDLMIAGMGLDGHTASLFPCAENIDSALSENYPFCCIAIHPKAAEFPRMSLSLSELKQCKQTIVLLQGENKWDVYEKALRHQEKIAWPEMPIRALLSNTASTHIYWSK